jgi:hypothetical protein
MRQERGVREDISKRKHIWADIDMNSTMVINLGFPAQPDLWDTVWLSISEGDKVMDNT